MKKKTRRKRKLVYIPRRYLDLATTKSWYLTSGIQLRVRDTINLLTWVNAEECVSGTGDTVLGGGMLASHKQD